MENFGVGMWDMEDIDGLMQQRHNSIALQRHNSIALQRHNSIANALELCLPCTNPSI